MILTIAMFLKVDNIEFILLSNLIYILNIVSATG
jgi:hypothetical protein